MKVAKEVIRDARIAGICSEEGSKKVPVSFAIEEDFFRGERSILSWWETKLCCRVIGQ